MAQRDFTRCPFGYSNSTVSIWWNSGRSTAGFWTCSQSAFKRCSTETRRGLISHKLNYWKMRADKIHSLCDDICLDWRSPFFNLCSSHLQGISAMNEIELNKHERTNSISANIRMCYYFKLILFVHLKLCGSSFHHIPIPWMIQPGFSPEAPVKILG